MIRSYKKVSQLNNSIQGAITCRNLNIQNQLVTNQIRYHSETGSTGSTGYTGPFRYGIYTGPTGFNITGPTGPTGISYVITGSQGETGPTGSIGIQNETGPIGSTGKDGETYQGSTGYRGMTGEINMITGPTGSNMSYNSISNTFNIISSSNNQVIKTISLNTSHFVQWSVTLTNTNILDVVTIYVGINQDMIPFSGNIFSVYDGNTTVAGSLYATGSGIYNSDITFQCYYNNISNHTFTMSYEIVYISLFNS
jgi:hypothetical protein